MGNKRQLEDTNIKCDRCGSGEWVGHGNNTTVKKGTRQRYKCTKCGHTFYKEEDK
jgi:transposase-like protein